jgi:hypothetical protein
LRSRGKVLQAAPSVVIPREGGVSSTPRLQLVDRGVSVIDAGAYWITRLRG